LNRRWRERIRRCPWRRCVGEVDHAFLRASTGVVRELWCGSEEKAARWCFPTPLREPIGWPRVVEWGLGHGETRYPSLRPPLPLYSAARRGPTNHGTVGRPRSGRDPGETGPQPLGWASEIILTGLTGPPLPCCFLRSPPTCRRLGIRVRSCSNWCGFCTAAPSRKCRRSTGLARTARRLRRAPPGRHLLHPEPTLTRGILMPRNAVALCSVLL
jgi:hypothetical protein